MAVAKDRRHTHEIRRLGRVCGLICLRPDDQREHEPDDDPGSDGSAALAEHAEKIRSRRPTGSAHSANRRGLPVNDGARTARQRLLI